jgi:hypothetical protein
VTILQEIHAWSKGLPVWQQDAIARLYIKRELGVTDLEDLYALAKVEAGIEDPKGRFPKKLDDAQVAAPVNPTRLVQLIAIKDLANVNALASGGRLPIAPTGLTVIYGENGAGKSGYSRVLKHACRARDRSEIILPDSRLDPAKAGRPSANFEVMIDGVPNELPWVFGDESPEPLSEISVFDTYCARAYIDNHGDFAYRPYGLDVLEGLVTACNKLKALATQEKVVHTPSNAAFSVLASGKTLVGKALLGIPRTTKAEAIEELARLSEAEVERLKLLVKTLSEADPKEKAQSLRQKANRLVELKERIAAAILLIDETTLSRMRALFGESKFAAAAADLAASDFKATLGLLPGTGGELWKALFEAARAFAKTSHEQHEIASLPTDSLCPLCQNPLGADGSVRLARFDEFIRQEAEAQAKTARSNAGAACQAVQTANLNLLLGPALLEELREIEPDLAASCLAAQAGLAARRAGALDASAEKIPWDQIQALPFDPSFKLDQLATGIVEQAEVLEMTADEKAKAAMVLELQELQARTQLGEIKDAVLEAIAKHELCRMLQNCIDGMDTRGISRKSTDLSRTMASQELADSLNVELKCLKVNDLYVGMKPESPGGRTQFKLTLQLPGGSAPSAVLSEGEQRAIAIASFLAEIKLGKGRGGIVFDDPVSSLDHRRRWEVAERLAYESHCRQVIVFTHDIYFLAILEQKAEAVGVPMSTNYIRRTSHGFGVHAKDLPFDLAGTKARVGQLRQIMVDVRQAKSDGDDDRHRSLTSLAYGRLRLAWERCIEEVLLNGVVQRFVEGVSTQKLKAVIVTDEDFRAIDAGMGKSSKFEHDAAASVGRLPLPEPDELSQDIERLEAFRLATDKRNKQGIATRA